MSEHEPQMIRLPAPLPDTGVYVLYVEEGYALTQDFEEVINTVWAEALAGKRLMILWPGLRLEWVGPPQPEPESASE